MRTLTMVAVAGLALASAAGAQGRRDGSFAWSERIPAGEWLRVHAVSGDVDVRRASGSEAEVRAEVIPGSRGVDEIAFEVLQDGSSYTICAVWTEGSRCDEQGVSTRDRRSRGRDAKVRFTVLLPRGVHLKATSGNGEVIIQNAGGDVVAASGNGRVHVLGAAGGVEATSGNGEVEVLDAGGPVAAHSGNGEVHVTTSQGPVNASSGNGDIEVEMLSLRGRDDMVFSSGNGTISIGVPSDFEGEVESSSGNGRFLTDFPVTVQGRLDPSRFRGTIGRGGRRVKMTTGNGNLELRRIR